MNARVALVLGVIAVFLTGFSHDFFFGDVTEVLSKNKWLLFFIFLGVTWLLLDFSLWKAHKWLPNPKPKFKLTKGHRSDAVPSSTQKVRELTDALGPGALLMNLVPQQVQVKHAKEQYERQPHKIWLASDHGPHAHIRKAEDRFSAERMEEFGQGVEELQKLIHSNTEIQRRTEILASMGVAVKEVISIDEYAMRYLYQVSASDAHIRKIEAWALDEYGYVNLLERTKARIRFRLWMKLVYGPRYKFWTLLFSSGVKYPYN